MVDTSSQISPVASSPATPAETTFGITAMVGLAGKLCGVLSLRCDLKSAALMTSKVLGVGLEKVNAEISDSMGRNPRHGGW